MPQTLQGGDGDEFAPVPEAAPDADAAGAELTVGYEAPSLFSREYASLFGEPSIRDVARLREAMPAGVEG